MADYSHHHTYRAARAPHRSSARRFGGVLAGAALLVMATLAWVWMQQRTVDSPLPHAKPAASGPVAAPAPPAKPAPIATRTSPAAESAPPSTAAVAAAGDTRAVR